MTSKKRPSATTLRDDLVIYLLFRSFVRTLRELRPKATIGQIGDLTREHIAASVELFVAAMEAAEVPDETIERVLKNVDIDGRLGLAMDRLGIDRLPDLRLVPTPPPPAAAPAKEPR